MSTSPTPQLQSEYWNHHTYRTINNRQAVIGFNLSFEQAEPTLDTLLKVRLVFKNPQPSGLPTSAEFDTTEDLEAQLTQFVASHGGVKAGRIVTDGHRDFYFYTTATPLSLEPLLERLRRETGFALELLSTSPDPEHEAYWTEIHPTAEEWQRLTDRDVLENMAAQGDDGSKPCGITHGFIFPTHEAAEPFMEWAKANSYQCEDGDTEDERSFRRWLTHYGPVATEISKHTILLDRMADEMGGEYDGWDVEMFPAKS